ncbi:hypothetical protein [uncultured Amnibacterium sp.]|uniref:hypothetical protein n=1 Tax=uncultured Amnibacterium sp. TaxID=1631851 RepID=UPI0035CBC06E
MSSFADVGPAAAMRASHERVAEHEGIPMVLAVFDARGTTFTESVEPALAEAGARFAALVARFHDELVPWAADDDEGALATVLSTVAFMGFDA